jgi:hypothetical protein
MKIKVVKKWSPEGIWHWLRFKPVRKQITRQVMFKGELAEVQYVNDFEYVFESRIWYNSLRRKIK